MRLRIYGILFLLFIISFSAIFSQNDFVPLKPEIYKARRTKLMESMDPNSAAVFISAAERNRNGDTDYRYRQESNFLYLCGLKESSTFFMLIPSGIEVEGKSVKEIIFVKDSDPYEMQWTGEKVGVKGAEIELGFETALSVKKFKDFFKKALEGKKILYITSPFDFILDGLTDKKYNIAQERKDALMAKFPGLEIKNLFSALAQMRVIKSEEELSLLRKAIDATCQGYINVLKQCKPEMYEYQIQSIIESAFMWNGCEYSGFPSIIGSGPNSCILHYDANRRKMKNGEVLVMDIGGEYEGYSADLTRTIPVNGKFSEEQKQIYKIVYKASEEIIKFIRPGINPRSLDSIAIKIVQDGLMSLGLIKSSAETRRYIPHGVSHNIGLEVHDVSVHGKLKAGQVITVEPGIYITETLAGSNKKYANIGIRIEDDILVTENGCESLTKNAPKSIEEIEKIMKK